MGCSTPSTTVSNTLCRIAHGRGVAVGVALNAGFGVTVDVLLAVELGEAVALNAAFGVIVDVDVGVFEKVAVGVAVGATTVRFNCLAGAVSAAPAALMNERFVNSMFDVPTTKPLSERVSTWTVPVWPLALLVVRLTRKFPLPWSVHVPVTMELLRLQLMIVISDVA